MPELVAGDPAWIGPFRLRERLGDGDGDGVGSLGPLYLGQSPLDHLVVVRALHPDLAADQGLRARLTRDVAAAREASGPHVAPLVGADLSGPAPWVAWEWVPGKSLAATVGGEPGSAGPGSAGPGNQRGPLPLPWPAFAALATQLAEGIWSLHEAGVIHGDLTPGSVFLGNDGAVLTGFGLGAAVAAFRAAAAAWPADVLEFLSPEQAAGGEATPASDMFSLGAVLAYALRGAGPYPVQAQAGRRHPIDYDHPDLDRIPDFLRPLIARCLRADPDSRAPSDGFAALLAVTIRSAPRKVIAALVSPATAVTPGAAAVLAAPPLPAAGIPAAPRLPAPGILAAPRLPAAAAPHGVVMPKTAPAPRTASPPTVLASPGQSSSSARPPRRRPPAALTWSVVALAALIGIIWISNITNRGPTPPVPGATQIFFTDYTAGDCLLGNVAANSGTWPDPVWLVPCADSHTYEVFYVNLGYWPDSQPYPGAQAADNAGGAECDTRFALYDGVQREDSLFTYTDVLPDTKDSWVSGIRQLVCLAFDPTAGHPDGAPTRGSIKDSYR
jgi:hypothetical protein